jgi:hypothetical protein
MTHFARTALSYMRRLELNGGYVPGFALIKEGSPADEIVYCGQIIDNKTKEGLREGIGVQVSKGKSVYYAGKFVNGLRHGHGYLEEGTFRYTGQFYKGKMHGECVLFINTAKGRRGSGTFVDDEMHGMGQIWHSAVSSKFSYNGEFVRDKMHGKGTLVNFKGTKSFTGDFVNDSICGHGVCTIIRTKHTITGTFRGEFCSGKGVARDAFGTVIYDGDYVDGLKQGEGIMYYANGEVYTGTFKKELKCGKGILLFADKSQYEGNFLNDRFHGDGAMTSAAGVLGNIAQYFKGVLRADVLNVRDVVDLSGIDV